jgi:hypothetical protein
VWIPGADQVADVLEAITETSFVDGLVEIQIGKIAETSLLQQRAQGGLR